MKVLVILIAIALSLAYFTFLYFLLLGNVLGDCFPGHGIVCPTGHQRDVTSLKILIGGPALYLAFGFSGWYLVRREKRRS